MAKQATAYAIEPLEGRQLGNAGVTISPVKIASRLNLRARDKSIAALGTALGVALPRKPKTSVTKGSRTALWIGPDEWLIIDSKAAINCAPKGKHLYSDVDVTHRNTAISVSGKAVEQVLNAGCPQDLSLAAFPVGACSRTVMGKIEIILLRTAPDTFHVECWRSFSDYAWAFLTDAAKDAG